MSTHRTAPQSSVTIPVGRDTITLRLPAATTVIQGSTIPTLNDPDASLRDALNHPIGSRPLLELVEEAKQRYAEDHSDASDAAGQLQTELVNRHSHFELRVAITISDITRPVPNAVIVGCLLDTLNHAGIRDAQVTIIVGTGMHRASTNEEKREMLGERIIGRCRVIDHRADDPETLTRVCNDPPVSVCREFVEADFRIVTGLIEPHFMAGFSGGRKGICPALVDLNTVQRFHGYQTLSARTATNGVLERNPCHEESLRIARTVGCDFLVNVAVDQQRRPAAFFAGNLEAAHEAGCRQVAEWVQADCDRAFDLVITHGGGYPLDQTFYQSVKGMVGALPVLKRSSHLLIVSDCGEGIGSLEYEAVMLQWGRDWRGFLDHIAATSVVGKDQWQFQMQARVLAWIGIDRLVYGTERIDAAKLESLGVTPLPGDMVLATRAQLFVDRFLEGNPDATVAVIPEGPYTMLHSTSTPTDQVSCS